MSEYENNDAALWSMAEKKLKSEQVVGIEDADFRKINSIEGRKELGLDGFNQLREKYKNQPETLRGLDAGQEGTKLNDSIKTMTKLMFPVMRGGATEEQAQQLQEAEEFITNYDKTIVDWMVAKEKGDREGIKKGEEWYKTSEDPKYRT